jgi:uncharacterized protein (DUF983 family)
MPCIRQKTRSKPDGVDGGNGQPLTHRRGPGVSPIRLGALLKQRCPRCLEGRVFAGLFRMHKCCPSCGLPFEREPGYFMGAMYLSYGLGIIATSPVWVPMAWSGRSLWEVLLASGSLLIVGSPWLFRYARVLWLYFDQALDPR